MTVIQGNTVDIERRGIYPVTIEISESGIIKKIEQLDIQSALKKKLPFIIPGFIDSHIHIELSKVLPSEYAKAALIHGVIGCITDSHEVANVEGKQGVLDLIQSVKGLPFYFGFSAPSCIVPKKYSLADIEELLAMNEVTHLGEMLDFPGVIMQEHSEVAKIEIAKKYHKPIDGHVPGLSGSNLKLFANSGISTDHECTSLDNIKQKIESGISVQLKTKNFSDEELVAAVNFCPDKIMICTDAISCNELCNGYLDIIASKLIKAGLNIFDLLKVLCVNPVKHYNLKTGLLKEGDSADFLVVEDLENFDIINVYIAGKVIYSKYDQSGFSIFNKKKQVFLNNYCSASKSRPEDFVIKTDSIVSRVNAISCFDGENGTVKKVTEMLSVSGVILSNTQIDCIKLVLYSKDNRFTPQVAFVHGFNLKRGAFAQSISHDSHDIIAVGTNDMDISRAINNVIKNSGGIAVSENNKLTAEMALPKAGLMSIASYKKVAEFSNKIHQTIKELGCCLINPIETLSFLAQSIIPTIKLTPDGLFDVVRQEIIPLFYTGNS